MDKAGDMHFVLGTSWELDSIGSPNTMVFDKHIHMGLQSPVRRLTA